MIDGYQTILYEPILRPFQNEATNRYGLMIQFGEPCVSEREGIKYLILNEEDLANLLATFNPLIGEVNEDK